MYQDLQRELQETPALDAGQELTMTDVLQLPAHLRLFLTWMMRQKVVPPETVSKYLEQDLNTTLAFLALLVSKGLAEEASSTGGSEKAGPGAPASEDETSSMSSKLFTVSVRSSRNFRVPDRIWKVFDA